MLLSCFQLLLTSLRRLLDGIQYILQLATSSSTISTAPPPQCEPEPKKPINVEKPDNHDRCLDRDTKGVPSKPLPHLLRPLYLSEKTLAPIEQPLPAVSLEEDELSAISRHAFGGDKVQTPTLNLTPLRDDDPTLQRVQAILTWLVHYHVQFTPTLPNNEIVISSSFASHLVQSSNWSNVAHVLTYVGTVLWNLARKDVKKPLNTDSMTMGLAEGIPNPPPQAPFIQSNAPTPLSPTSEASVLPERRFFPAHRSLLGCIEKPRGTPFCIGGYSDVWQCNVRFSTPSAALPAKVAVKVLRPVWMNGRGDADAKELLQQRFEQEVITWFGLPNHPNIAPLIGWTLAPDLSFISPWYEQGNLYRHLKGLSETQKIYIVLGIAKGLECLHSCNPPVVHGDLKPENILLSDRGEPLLADFGLSTILGEEKMYTPSHGVGGSAPWMAPEQMVEGSRSCQSDVYSFGNLAFTVMTGELPHVGLTTSQITYKVWNSKDSNGPVEDWSAYPQLQGPIKDILKDCWSWSPSPRPSMSAVVRRLTPLLESRHLESHVLST